MKVKKYILSPYTAKKVNWDEVTESQQKILKVTRGEKQLDEDYPGRIESAFKSAKTEFDRVLLPLRKQMKVTLWIILPALGLAIGGGILIAATKNVIWGSSLGSAAFIGLITMVRRLWELGRDQAILELTPSTYETLFGVCQSRSDFEMVFKAFILDITEMRSRL